MQGWQAGASATLVGSMPHRDRDRTIDFILQQVPDLPVWPQLSTYEPEQMMHQYLEGLPGIRTKEGRLFVETNTPQFEQELYGFYEEYLEVEAGSKPLRTSRFGFGEETGRTFFRFLEKLESRAIPFKALKGQVVGPFTLLAGLKDHQDRSLLYDERCQELVAKHLAMKARWQIEHLGAAGVPVILFLDEPALAGFGSSAFIGASRELVAQVLTEVIDAIHAAGGLAGIHVCANTDWTLAFDSSVDIINFDAYNYFDKFALYEEAYSRFLREGRTIAWGMVPTGDPAAIQFESAEKLAERWLEDVRKYTPSEISIAKILSQSLFTPSCGCASLPEPLAERVVQLTGALGGILKASL